MNPEIGDVAERTAYVRFNGLLRGEPSFTILSNRCVHLGCPVQANGPTTPERQRTHLAGQRKVTYTPVLPAGFGCPCHGGQYDTEGNRTAGPPVRALDRWAYKVADGRLRLIGAYSVDEVEGSGADATLGAYRLAQPGVHIDGLVPGPLPVHPAELMPKSERRKQVETVVTYPLDWIEERTGWVGAVKYFLFRKVPKRTNWFHTLGSATLTAFLVQVDHRDHPRDVLQAGSRRGVRVDPLHHERPHVGLARPRHAPLGRERLHHPHVLPHGAGVSLRRLQVPARGELDRRRRPAHPRDVRGLHRVPLAVGPDVVLGLGRRHQHHRHGPLRRPVPGQHPEGGRRDRRQHVVPLLLDPHARLTVGDRRPDPAPPLARDPPWRVEPAVGEAA